MKKEWHVTIHQPDFMPWIGFFDKISKVDQFIILDHVTNTTKATAFWGRRVKMMVNKMDAWISIPLEKSIDGPFQPINEMKIKRDDRKNLENTFKTIQLSYKKAPFHSEVIYLIEDYFNNWSDLVSVRNIDFITEVNKRLSISPNIILSSDLLAVEKGTDLLIELLLKTGATHYRCGMGAKAYQDDDKIRAAGIEVIYNNYKPKPYFQFNSKIFVPGLSIIDVLMNHGFEKTTELLQSNLI